MEFDWRWAIHRVFLIRCYSFSSLLASAVFGFRQIRPLLFDWRTPKALGLHPIRWALLDSVCEFAGVRFSIAARGGISKREMALSRARARHYLVSPEGRGTLGVWWHRSSYTECLRTSGGGECTGAGVRVEALKALRYIRASSGGRRSVQRWCGGRVSRRECGARRGVRCRACGGSSSGRGTG